MNVLNIRFHFNCQIINSDDRVGHFYDSKARVGFALVLFNNCKLVLPVKEHAEFRTAIQFALKIQIKECACNGIEH